MATLLKSIVLFSFCFGAFGSGRFLIKKGKVTVDKVAVKKGSRFADGQELSVGKNSLAVVRFKNGNTLKINENTTIRLESTGQNKKKKESVFRLIKGSSFFSKNKKNGEEMTVKASTAAMGVRGTTFFVSYGVKKPEDIYMCVKKGVVAVKGAGDQKEVLVKEGQGVVISKGKKTSNPKFLPWTKNLNWKLSSKDKDLVNKASIEESYGDVLDKDYD